VAPNSNASPAGLNLTILPTSQFSLRYHLSAGVARKALASSLESRRESDLNVARDWKSTSASLGLYEIDFGNRTDILPIPLLTTSQLFLHSDYKFDRLNLH